MLGGLHEKTKYTYRYCFRTYSIRLYKFALIA